MFFFIVSNLLCPLSTACTGRRIFEALNNKYDDYISCVPIYLNLIIVYNTKMNVKSKHVLSSWVDLKPNFFFFFFFTLFLHFYIHPLTVWNLHVVDLMMPFAYKYVRRNKKKTVRLCTNKIRRDIYLLSLSKNELIYTNAHENILCIP